VNARTVLQIRQQPISSGLPLRPSDNELVLDPRVAGSNPAEVNGCLKVIKIYCTTSFGREVKPLIKLIFFL
jgi:hypothetical protein